MRKENAGSIRLAALILAALLAGVACCGCTASADPTAETYYNAYQLMYQQGGGPFAFCSLDASAADMADRADLLAAVEWHAEQQGYQLLLMSAQTLQSEGYWGPEGLQNGCLIQLFTPQQPLEGGPAFTGCIQAGSQAPAEYRFYYQQGQWQAQCPDGRLVALQTEEQ